MKIAAILIVFCAVYSAGAQTRADSLLPFGLRHRMPVAEVMDAAKQSGLVPVTRIDERDMKSISIYPRSMQLADQNVDNYQMIFFRNQLWGLNVWLESSGSMNEHFRRLENLISWVKSKYPGNVKVSKLDRLKEGKDRLFSYVLEMMYGSLLVTVISDYDTSSSKYSSTVTFSNCAPGKFLAKGTM
jgi:hypothetical protein